MKGRPSLRAKLTAIPPRRLIVFMDYDGTVTPIVQRPEDARFKPSIRRTLSQPVHSVPVVIVSGRELSDLEKRVGLPDIRYVALHGLWYKEPGSAIHCGWVGYLSGVKSRHGLEPWDVLQRALQEPSSRTREPPWRCMTDWSDRLIASGCAGGHSALWPHGSQVNK